MSTLGDIAAMNGQLASAKADGQELVRYKQRMDSLKQRLSGAPGEEQQLREACRDFEAVFIGKLWEQMRRTVPKESAMHSKQEDMYLSMFDRSFSEHMADSGGIGLADMLYDQLASQLRSASRDTLTGGAEIKPLERNGKADVKSLEEVALDTRLHRDGARGPEPASPEELSAPVEAGDVTDPQAGSSEMGAWETGVPSSRGEVSIGPRTAPLPVDALSQAEVNARLDRLAEQLGRRRRDPGRILAEYK
ncbi:MAG: rod-binding protein [Desulfovibrio sp.]|jgi:flagellar protein FlgJ|nr:rod-binding protein [Desulfovibrio sp.]